jgi:carbon monoxide dehydrogenase subunit G
MKLEGTKPLKADRARVWEILDEPARTAKLLPGVESFEVVDERHWTANVKVPLGLGGLKLKMKFEKLEERPLEFARLKAKGTGVGAMLNMETRFELEDGAAPGETVMKWEADVRVAGPVGSMGQRVLQPIVNQQVENVLTALDEQAAAAS